MNMMNSPKKVRQRKDFCCSRSLKYAEQMLNRLNKGVNNMTIRAKLETIKKLKVQINMRNEDLEVLRDLTEAVTAQLKENPSSGHGGVSDKIGSIVPRIVELEADLDRRKQMLEELQSEVLNKMETLNKTEYDILYKRYFQLKSWGEIAFEVHYSKTGVFEKHKQILKKIS